MRSFVAVVCVLAMAAVANANIYAYSGLGMGWSPMPATISFGGWTLSQAPNDTQPTGYYPVGSFPINEGSVGFSHTMYHIQVGMDWATWAMWRTPKGYYDGYYPYGAPMTMTLPANVGAFAFWLEPNSFATHTFTATASDGTTATLTQSPTGYAGALGYGFYTGNGQSIKSVTITGPYSAYGYAIAEFYSAPVPEPATLSLLGLAGLALLRRR